MVASGSSARAPAERTIRELVNLGFPESRVREAIEHIGDASDAQMAINWLLDHGEEDKGGAVEFKHCPHVDQIAYDKLIPIDQLQFGKPCLHRCKGDENWLCLMCGETRCGRYMYRHSLQHWEETKRTEEKQLTVAEAAAGSACLGHCLTLGLADLSVWCYECESYVHHENLQPRVKRMEQIKFGEVPEGKGLNSSHAAASEAPRVGSQIPAKRQAAHGVLAEDSWPLPKFSRVSADEARPGYKSMGASEFLDEPDVLRAKVKKLASMIRRSKSFVAYTGAGISTASGIPDYATKANESLAGGDKKKSPFEAQPTFAHRSLVALHKAGHLKHWVQQNHDGLPQKAGFPQSDLNEIHGAWYDPSNPVVPMDGTLRGDLIERMLDWEDRVDLCLALGTSMVGMNADRMAVAPAERRRRGQEGALGTVIVALQQTQYDALSSIRIFATIDRTMELLAEELALTVPPSPEACPWTDGPILTGLPYNSAGGKDPKSSLRLDLRPGTKLRVINQPDWDEARYGNTCVVVEPADIFAREGHIQVRFGAAGSSKSITRILGRWWLQDAIDGKADVLPVVPAI